MRGAPQRPTVAGFRQPSIGLRRGPSNQPLQPVPAVGTTPMQRSTSRLPVLDETCALEHPQRTSSNASTASRAASPQGQEPTGLLAKVKSKLGFGGNDNNGDGAAMSRPASNTAQPGMDYSSNMVDVLDTLGTFLPNGFPPDNTNLCRR